MPFLRSYGISNCVELFNQAEGGPEFNTALPAKLNEQGIRTPQLIDAAATRVRP
jgi:hypothetical protein